MIINVNEFVELDMDLKLKSLLKHGKLLLLFCQIYVCILFKSKFD